jgi:hypothetical protein
LRWDSGRKPCIPRLQILMYLADITMAAHASTPLIEQTQYAYGALAPKGALELYVLTRPPRNAGNIHASMCAIQPHFSTAGLSSNRQLSETMKCLLMYVLVLALYGASCTLQQEQAYHASVLRTRCMLRLGFSADACDNRLSVTFAICCRSNTEACAIQMCTRFVALD